MDLILLYKSYNTPNRQYVKGEILIVDDEYGAYLLSSFPEWFEKRKLKDDGLTKLKRNYNPRKVH